MQKFLAESFFTKHLHKIVLFVTMSFGPNKGTSRAVLSPSLGGMVPSTASN